MSRFRYPRYVAVPIRSSIFISVFETELQCALQVLCFRCPQVDQNVRELLCASADSGLIPGPVAAAALPLVAHCNARSAGVPLVIQERVHEYVGPLAFEHLAAAMVRLTAHAQARCQPR
jgi:hypothetical protein